MHDVEPVVVPDEPAGRIEVFDKFRHVIGAAVAVGVAEPQDAPTVRIAPERAVAITRYVKIAVGRRRHEDRIIRGC